MRMNKNNTRMGLIERLGAALPESNILFLIMIGIIMVISYFAKGVHSGVQEGTKYTVLNMLSIDGFRWILYNVMNNFRQYPPLALIVIGVIGFCFAEKVGILGALIKKIGGSTPQFLILPVIVFLGINSSVASDAGYIVLIPLAGALYAGIGRNPLTGLVAAFAAVSAGFGACLIPTPGDGLLGTITKSVITDTMWIKFPYNEVTMNYIFMIFSTLMLTVLITFVTKKFIERRANHHKYIIPQEDLLEVGKLNEEEKKGLRKAGITLIIVLAVLAVLYFSGVLSSYTYIDASGDEITKKPILDNIIVILVIVFVFPGISYGKAVGKIGNSKDYIALTTDAMKDIAYIMVFAVFAGNFLAIFSHSGLDKFISNNGAKMLISLNIQNEYFLMAMFIAISAFINIFMGSASAKWVLLAPVFVPMLITVSNGNLGPDQIQAAYRVADSSTNIITPLMTYAGVILVFAKKYVPRFEIGDLISIMVPYSVAIFIVWTVFLLLWLGFGLPFGI